MEPAAFDLRIGTAGQMASAVTRSHLHDGRVVGWYGASGVVIDAEVVRGVPLALARRFGADDFWGRWTRSECVAKRDDVPIVILLAMHGLPHQVPGVSTMAFPDSPEVVVSLCTVRGS